MQKQSFHRKFIIVLILGCTAGVKSLENLGESKSTNIDDSSHCHKTLDNEEECRVDAATDKEGLYSENNECNAKLRHLESSKDCHEKSCNVIDTTILKDDQSELLLLEQGKELLVEEISIPSQKCEKTVEEDTNSCHQESIQKITGEIDDQVIHENTEVKYDCSEDTNDCDKITKDKNGHEVNEQDLRSTDNSLTNGNARETERDEMDPELENVPLREILLKLKPEGLTDDEDEQPSDYSVTEASMGEDIEVEEEVLVSSGSAEKQEQVSDSHSSSSSNNSSSNSINSGGGSKKAVCSDVNVTECVTDVEVVNATVLMKLLQVDPNVTSRSSVGPCYLIYFYSPYCPFSVMGSPYVNALARSVPDIPVYGLDSIEHHSVNARYGVMGTPTLLLFHNGNAVGRYNASEYSVSQLMSFVKHYTDQDIININVTSSDFRANLPSQVAEGRPYALWAAWTFLIGFASWLFLTSELCARLTEAILNNWREAEAQNDHHD